MKARTPSVLKLIAAFPVKRKAFLFEKGLGAQVGVPLSSWGHSLSQAGSTGSGQPPRHPGLGVGWLQEAPTAVLLGLQPQSKPGQAWG